MSTYHATVAWQRGDAKFTDNKYSRGHEWAFDGVTIPASSSPHVVPRHSVEQAVDPEEAFVASLASCHMLFLLSFAASDGFTIDSYTDQAEGLLGRDESGRQAMTQVTLRPRVSFSGKKVPTSAEHETLHHRAHEACFIASSVRSVLICEPEMVLVVGPSHSTQPDP